MTKFKSEYTFAKILCAFAIGFSFAIAVAFNDMEAYAVATLGIIGMIVVSMVEKHNRSVTEWK